MSTATAPTEPIRETTVTLVANLSRLYLSHNRDVYHPNGRMETLEQGRCVRFLRNEAEVPESWLDDVRSHPEFGLRVWIKGDPSVRNLADKTGPTVREGAMTTVSRAGSGSTPPTEEWDTTSAQKLRPLIMAARVELSEALMWEFEHRNRASVIKLLQESRSQHGAPEGEVEGEDEPETDGAILTTTED